MTLPIIARTFFGDDLPLEAAGQRPDLRDARTLADDLQAERRLTAAIAADPFSHIPAVLMTSVMHCDKVSHHGLRRDYRDLPAKALKGVRASFRGAK